METLCASVKNDLENNDPAAVAAKIHKYLEEQHITPLNIAVTGESGSGKSTFVNAFRGIGDEDEGAAPVGIIERSMDPLPYFHPDPDYPNVIVWDLPGIGTNKFQAEKYLERVGFEKFDFFFIISADRFRENDAKLTKEIQKMKKKFYFICSKIDNDMRAEERRADFNKERILRKIKDDCVQDLQKQGIESPQVFLISSFERHLYDFPLLHETFEQDLPQLRRDALLFAMCNTNLEIINNKKEALRSKIKYYASLSAGVAAVPLPGLSTAVDVGLIVTAVREYVQKFGLDRSSLQRLSNSTDVPYADLLKVTMSPLVGGEITKEVMLNILPQLGCITALLATEEAVRWIPIIGNIASVGLSFTTTHRVLNYFLDTLAEDAQRVFRRAFENFVLISK